MLIYLSFSSDSPITLGMYSTTKQCHWNLHHPSTKTLLQLMAALGTLASSATLYHIRVAFSQGLPSLSHFLLAGEWWLSPGISQLRRCSFYTWSRAFKTTYSSRPIVSSGFKSLTVCLCSRIWDLRSNSGCQVAQQWCTLILSAQPAYARILYVCLYFSTFFRLLIYLFCEFRPLLPKGALLSNSKPLHTLSKVFPSSTQGQPEMRRLIRIRVLIN